MTLAVTIRVAAADRMAVEHFDEGVYAASSNDHFWFGDNPDFRFPDRHLYAPPLLPTLIRWSINLLGEPQLAPMLPAVILGSLTVVATWWIGRCWFGPVAGMSAAALAACSDFHASYSRTALTDAPLTFWLAVATFAIWKLLTRPEPIAATAAILATAAAWYTKYSGWLPLAIGAAGGAAYLLSRYVFGGRAGRRELLVIPAGLAIVTLGTGLLWSFYLASLPDPGYAAVAANHAKYLVGLDAWWPGLAQQWMLSRHYDGWLTLGGFALASLAAYLASRGILARSTWNAQTPEPWNPAEQAESRQPNRTASAGESALAHPDGSRLAGAAWALLPLAGAAAIGTTGTLALAGIIGLPALLFLTRPRSGSQKAGKDEHQAEADNRHSHLAAWLLAAWFFGLLLTVPLYTPYPRLTLPWHAAGWLIIGGLFSKVVATRGSAGRTADAAGRADQPHRTPARGVLATLLLCELAVIGYRLPAVHGIATRAWEDRTALRDLADRIRTSSEMFAANHDLPIENEVRGVYYVFGEPALLYQLGAGGAIATPQADLGFADSSSHRLPVPVFLVTGPHSRTDAKFDEGMRRWGDWFEPVERFDVRPSSLVRFDRGVPRPSPPREDAAEDVYRVYWLRPTPRPGSG